MQNLITFNDIPQLMVDVPIYGWTSAKKIPFHKRGKSILFNKAEIDEWLNDSTHHKSVQELERDAMSYINSKRRGLAKKGGWK